MEIYRSAGVAIIAALIGPDHRSDGRRPASSAGKAPGVGRDLAQHRESQAIQMQPEFRQISRRCERAVVTAYRELRVIGAAEPEAFQACTTLYRIHHPEASLSQARRLAAEWVDHHVVRGSAGPTSGCECSGG